ncbi:MAG: hypothetical protein KQA41_01420 [Candidatus Aenigmarchaeota archaeon]|nr:hypothetical protein [Candidatus Aenigmarchaeota archaeon]
MKEKILILLFLLTFSNVYALKIEFIDHPETVYTLEKSFVKFRLTNDGDKKETFYISVWPSSWISLEKYFVVLDPGKSEVVQFSVEPPIDANIGNIVFSVSARSTDSGNVTTEDIILNVRRRTGTYISDIKLNQDILSPKETLLIQPVLVNLDKTQSKQLIIRTKIFKDGNQIKMFEEQALLQPSSTKTISTPFEITNDYSPGTYNIQVFIYDKFGSPIHSKTSAFVIKKYSDFEKDKKIYRSLLETEFLINVTNKGNYPQSFVITETMPKIAKYFFYPEIEPQKEEEKENRVIYTWITSEIEPNTSYTIKYYLRFSNAAFVTFLILLFISFILTLFHKPTLLKKYSEITNLEKGNLVTLHVRNNSIREIHNVVVKDTVPSVFAVVKEFDTLKPEVKVTQTGTTLIWKIDKLRPKEDRVLTYRIKPVMNVEGKIKLPKAYFSYKSGKIVISKIAEKVVFFSKKVE